MSKVEFATAAKRAKVWSAVVSLCAVWLVSCGRATSTSSQRPPSAGPSQSQPKQMSVAQVVAQIDAYPVPSGVSADKWATLTSALKQRVGAQGSGKTFSSAPTGTNNAVSDLAAVANGAGTQGTVTWTEKLWGDCNNDGQVDIADLQPIATHYGETSSGPGSAAYLADADGDGQVAISDLQPIVNDYSMHLQGYVVWRGHWNGMSVDWEATPRPNPNAANPNWSADRTATPSVSTRPAYTYTDDLSGVTDKANVRYKVVPYGDSQAGAESNVAVMPPPTPTGFNVSGVVLSLGNGLAGVAMTLTPGGLNATTAGDGTYTITGVANGSYTLTPAKFGYFFTPADRPVTVSGADVTGQSFDATPTYAVSGTVLDDTSTAVAGVTLMLTPGGLTAITAADGTYSIPGAQNGGYTLTPSLTNYTFSPSNRSVTVSGADLTSQNFIATQLHTISGLVTNGSTMLGMPGVTMTLTPGGATGPTDATGNFALTVQNGLYTLTPSLSGYTFSPPNRSVTVSGTDVPGQNFTGAIIPSLAATPWPKFHQSLDNAGRSTVAGPVVPTVKWTQVLDSGFAMQSSPALGPDGTIYFGTGAGHVFALNPADGTTKWVLQLTSNAPSSPAVAADGTIYIGCFDGNLYALRSTDGTVKWASYINSGVESSPTIGSDGTIYVGQNVDGLYALNPADGSQKWVNGMTGAIKSCPAIGSDGTVYFAGAGTGLRALNPATGAPQWGVSGNSTSSSPVLSPDGSLIYYGGNDGVVRAYNASSHSLAWSYPATMASISSSPAVAADGTVYIGANNSLYAFWPNGMVKWSYATAGLIESSPVVDSTGKVYFGSDDNTVYALNSMGTLDWNFDTGYQVTASPAIGGDGTLYVATNNGTVIAIGP